MYLKAGFISIFMRNKMIFFFFFYKIQFIVHYHWSKLFKMSFDKHYLLFYVPCFNQWCWGRGFSSADDIIFCFLCKLHSHFIVVFKILMYRFGIGNFIYSVSSFVFPEIVTEINTHPEIVTEINTHLDVIDPKFGVRCVCRFALHD